MIGRILSYGILICGVVMLVLAPFTGGRSLIAGVIGCVVGIDLIKKDKKRSSQESITTTNPPESIRKPRGQDYE